MQYTGASNADLVLAIPMLVGTKNFTAYCMNKKATQRGVGIMTLPCGKPLHLSGAAEVQERHVVLRRTPCDGQRV